MLMVEYFLIGCIVGVIIASIYHKRISLKSYRKTQNIKRNQKRIFSLIEKSKDIVYCFQILPEFKFIYLSPSIEKFLGEGLVNECYENPNNPFELIHPDDLNILYDKIYGTLDFEKPIVQRWRNREGKYLWFEEHATPIYSKGKLVAVQGIIRNIDEKIKYQLGLEYRVTHDMLTGLHNKDFFERACNKYDVEIDSKVAIIMCDLDNLKITNDIHGHMEGDNLIKGVGTILNKFSSTNSIVSRIGGDEFCILLTDLNESCVKKIVEDIDREIHKFNEVNLGVDINISIGYSFSQKSLGHMDSLFKKADSNMYKIKNNKKAI